MSEHLLLTLVIVQLDSCDTNKLLPQTKSSNYSQLICAANRPFFFFFFFFFRNMNHLQTQLNT